MKLSDESPKIELPPAEELQEMIDTPAEKKKPRNTSYTGRASKNCHSLGHEWRDPETGEIGAKCCRCGKVHVKRGRVNLG